MKKMGNCFLASLVVLVLAACNDSAVPTKGSENNSELTLEEVYQKALERQNELESVSAIVDMEQEMSFGSGEEAIEINSKSDMKMDMITKPLSVYMEGTIGTGDQVAAEELNMNLKMYMTEDGLYMHDGLEEYWTKLPTDDFDAILEQTAGQVNAAEQLEQMKEFISDFKFEQTDSSFILKLDTSSEKFNEFMLGQLNLNEMLATEETQQLLQDTKFEKVGYEITINKETFDITEMVNNINFTMNIEGESISTISDSKISFNNFNGVEEITIPQEVIDTAQEIEY